MAASGWEEHLGIFLEYAISLDHYSLRSYFCMVDCRVNWTNISVAVNPEQDSWIQVHVNFTCKDVSLPRSIAFRLSTVYH